MKIQHPSLRDCMQTALYSFELASDALTRVPTDEPSDLDGPLGEAVAQLYTGAEILTIGLDEPGLLPSETHHAKAALRDAREAVELLASWDDAGGDAGQAKDVVSVSSRLVDAAADNLRTGLALDVRAG